MAKEDVKLITRFGERMKNEIRRSLQTEMIGFVKHIKTEHLTGGTKRTKLGVRTGRLRASVKYVPIEIKGSKVETGITLGTVYGPIHFGPLGSLTPIVPVKKKWLTIPLKAALTKAGVSRGGALSGAWGDTEFKRIKDEEGTFIRKSKRGKLILFGRKVAQRGKFAGQTRGKLVPLFLLVKQVEIPARVDPSLLAAWVQPKLINAFRQATSRATEK